MLKKILIGLGVLVVLVVAAAVIIPMVVPVESYKGEITAQVRKATGRDMVINGDIDLTVIPTTALSVSDVTFSNAPGGQAEQMATLKQLDIEVKLIPLISGRLELDRLVLTEPAIHLEVDEQGNPNWVFEGEGSAADRGTAEGGDAQDGGGQAGGGTGLEDIQLGDVRLVDGLITYTDRSTGQSEEFRDVDVTIELESMQSPLDVAGDFEWHGEEVALEAHVERPQAALAGETTPIRYGLSSNPINSSFDGTLTNAATLQAAGDVSLDVPSVRELADWVGNPIDAEEGTFGPLNISGRLAVDGPKVSFDNAQLALDDIKGSGAFAVDTGGAVPQVEATLDLESLDLNPYMGGAAADTANGGSGESGGAGDSGSAGAQDWSTEPIDASPLRSVNANARLSANAIRVQDIKIDRGAIQLALSDGKLTLDLSELKLYDGQGTARMVVDGSGQGVGVSLPNMSLTGLAAKPFLTDAAGFSDLSGTANFQASDIRAAGKSQKELVSNLAGGGSFEFLDGALEGTNLALALRQITSMGQAQAKSTDFARIAGTFNIANGILTNNDLSMQSQLLRLAGEGVLSMPPKTVDYKLTPRGVLSLEGQGGATDVGGVVVPVRLVGPWHDVRNQPVWSEMKVIGPNGELSAASAANLDQLPDSMKDKIPSEVLGNLPGLLGGATGTGEDQKPEDMIKGILGGGADEQESDPSSGETGESDDTSSDSGSKLPGGLDKLFPGN